MKTFRSSKGPFSEIPFYTPEEIEQVCLDELEKLGLCPKTPSPIRIDRFIEKRFHIGPTYEDLPPGVVGFTRFGQNGVEEIVIAKRLDEEGTAAAERRLRSTLAHESGHGLLQAHLFALDANPRPLFGDGLDPTFPKILCRDEGPASRSPGAVRRYDGRWWEFQANQAMGALLLPRSLVKIAIDDMLETRSALGGRTLTAGRRQEAARVLAETFEVNPVVARIRLDAIYGEEAGQLTL